MGDLTNPTIQHFANPASQDRNARDYLGDVFLLNPANRKFVEGNTERPATQGPRAGCIMLFLIPFLLVGAAVMVWAWSSFYQWNTLNRAGIPGIAEISDKRISSGDDSDIHYLTYRFSNAAMIYTREQSVSSDLYNRAEVGAKVDITYAQYDPNIVVIAGTNNLPWFPIGFGLCWNILIWSIFVTMLTGIWGNRLLERDGRVITGHVIASAGSVDSDGDFNLKLNYAFHSPTDNGLISGTTQLTRNDLKGNTLPTQGAPLAILYRKDKHHKPL